MPRLPHPDELPGFPYHRIDMARYVRKTFLGRRTLPPHSSYGCPFFCHFCAVVNMVDGGWLAESAERTAAVAGRLFGWPWGLVALLALAVAYHEPRAPRQVWLHVLASLALLRVLPAGRARGAVSLYRTASLLALLAIAVPFVADQVRTALFPQLEHGRRQVGQEHELSGLAPAERAGVLEAVSAAISGPTWDHLRRRRGHSVARARAVVQRTVAALLRDAGVGA